MTPTTSTLGCIVIYKQKLTGKRTPIQCADFYATWDLANERRGEMLEWNRSEERHGKPVPYRDIKLVSSFAYSPVVEVAA